MRRKPPKGVEALSTHVLLDIHVWSDRNSNYKDFMGCFKKVKQRCFLKRSNPIWDFHQLDMFQEDMLDRSFGRSYCEMLTREFGDGISQKEVRKISQSKDVFTGGSVYSPDECA